MRHKVWRGKGSIHSISAAEEKECGEKQAGVGRGVQTALSDNDDDDVDDADDNDNDGGVEDDSGGGDNGRDCGCGADDDADDDGGGGDKGRDCGCDADADAADGGGSEDDDGGGGGGGGGGEDDGGGDNGCNDDAADDNDNDDDADDHCEATAIHMLMKLVCHNQAEHGHGHYSSLISFASTKACTGMPHTNTHTHPTATCCRCSWCNNVRGGKHSVSTPSYHWLTTSLSRPISSS
eukprot:460784-Pelagomonas_calceolata.AAC.3